MVKNRKDETNCEIEESNKVVVVTRLIQDEFDYEEYLRHCASMEHTNIQVEDRLKETKIQADKFTALKVAVEFLRKKEVEEGKEVS